MLLPVYNALQTKLNGIPNVQHLDWFNDQYAGTIHAEPGIFIEFPEPIPTEILRKNTQQGELIIRIHVYSKAVAQIDKSIDKTVIAKHFDITEEVFQRLQGFRSADEDKLLFNSLDRTAFQHHQYMQGWFVTTQDFECIIYDMKPEDTTPAPDALITIE
ncbi:MAG: hypothetical protein U9Q83_00090 [Bacteroidota bacterium]|nr:hypothetical protein [Bacteroidota bacterium]